MKWIQNCAGSYSSDNGIVIWHECLSGKWCIVVDGVIRDCTDTLKEAKQKAETY